MRQERGNHWSLLLAGMLSVSLSSVSLAQSTASQSTAAESKTPPLPTVVPFNPSVAPAMPAVTPPLGYRYASLSKSQTRALRRGFKLPMDALSTAASPSDLIGAAVVAPLPDPNRPFLPVAGTPAESSDPFNKSLSASFREDPMGALGQLLGADASAEIDPAILSNTAAGDPFGGGAEVTGELDDQPAAADAADTALDDDPFATSDDEDPFGDF